MPRFPDATGYLLEMRDTLGEPWFAVVCDRALANGAGALDQAGLDLAWEILHGRRNYQSAVATPAAVAPRQAPNPCRLEEIGPFRAYKKLSPSLTLRFAKQVTLVFGKNGSGKSSVCRAIQVLASPQQPVSPLHNVRVSPAGSPEFDYRMNGAATSWSAAAGFGVAAGSLKYFDSTVALRHLQGAVDPAAAVEVEAFRLEVFEHARAAVGQFQRHAQAKIESASLALIQRIQGVMSRLEAHPTLRVEPLASWTPATHASVAAHIAAIPALVGDEEAQLAELAGQIVLLETALSDTGGRSLRSEVALLRQLEQQLREFAGWCVGGNLAILVLKLDALDAKKAAAMELARGVFPAGCDHDAHHALLQAAERRVRLGAIRSGGDPCPLCLRVADGGVETLFQAYHAYLNSTLQAEIRRLEGEIRAAGALLEKVASFSLADYTACAERLPTGFLVSLGALVGVLQRAAGDRSVVGIRAGAAAFARHLELPAALAVVEGVRRQLEEALQGVTNDRATMEQRLRGLRERHAALAARLAIEALLPEMKAICSDSRAHQADVGRVERARFTPRLQAMTVKGKEAHGELVLGTFEQRLDGEYLALAGARMADLGVKLTSRGANQEIIVTPKIGDHVVERVLSEGEQKVHSLAIFFCEASVTPHQVLVFDDPVTSFDYNYSSNFCIRLRDLVRSQPTTQVILLTHNWHFFVEVQRTLKRSQLDARLQVQVMEHCATVEEYVERWDELCAEIDRILAVAGEPSPSEKERLSGYLRRLIERASNEFVFNNQRQQYKNKALQDSSFTAFTKLVPLLPAEADELGDLYGVLSPAEHDDPRNYYVGKSKLMFTGWYNRIKAVKSAIQARRP